MDHSVNSWIIHGSHHHVHLHYKIYTAYIKMIEMPPTTQFLKLVGHNIKVPVRSAPTAEGEKIKYLFPNDIIEVKVVNSKNFYRLADDSVSLCFH